MVARNACVEVRRVPVSNPALSLLARWERANPSAPAEAEMAARCVSARARARPRRLVM